MPKPLVNLSLPAPGFLGLNKQSSGSTMQLGWASEAVNLIFDAAGRLSSRKGYQSILTSNPSGTPKAVHEYIDGVGNNLVIFATNNAIYKDNSDGTSTDISGTITTPTADNWQFTNFNGKCVGFQVGHAPIVMSTTSGSFADITFAHATGAPTTAVNAACAAFGRLWVLDGTNLRYSCLLDETNWANNCDGTGGTAQLFDLSSYWKSGMDEGVAVAEYNGYLVVFGKDNTIIFSKPYDPASTMQIVENIGGIGCIARDSIQDVGTDLLFLSRTGVRSLGRTIQEKSMPVRDISKNIKDYLLDTYSAETGIIKSAYNSEEGFYILSLPSNSKTFVFDLKRPLEDGSLRVTEWDIGPTALEYTQTNVMYMAFATNLSQYTGYSDAVARDGTGGSVYSLSWYSGWNDFGGEVSSLNKIPKKLSVLMGGILSTTVVAKWAYDYIDTYYQSNIPFSTASLSRYGTAKYAVDTYSGAVVFKSIKAPLSSQGQVIKFGIEANVGGTQVILQRLDMLAKVGRYAA